MALEGQTVDVPLLPMSQRSPTTTGPVGRIKRLVNGIARRFDRTDRGQVLRIEKRNGFDQLPTATVRDPTTGATSASALVGSRFAAALKDRLTVNASALHFVESEAANGMECTPTICPTEVLRARQVTNSSNLLANPDAARSFTRTLYTWSQDAAPVAPGSLYTMMMIVDDDGTVIKLPTIVDTTSATIPKAMNDGAQFWVVYATGALINFVAYDQGGLELGRGSQPRTANSYYDVTVDRATTRLRMVQKDSGSAALKLYTVTWNGSAVTFASAVVAGTLAGGLRVQFLRNATSDTNYYIAASDGAGPYDWRVYQVDGTGTSLHTYTIATAKADNPIEFAGVTEPGSNPAITVALSTLHATDVRQNQSLIYTVTFAGVSTLRRTVRSLTLVSRSFPMGGVGREYVVMYYQPDPAAASAQQGTYFLHSIRGTSSESVGPWQIAGRWDYGQAYADWQTGSGTTYCQVTSPQVAPDGAIHTGLAYRATSFTANVRKSSIGDDTAWLNIRANTIGLRDYVLGPDHTQPVECDGVLMIGGPQAVIFDGQSLVEDGLSVIPELVAPFAGGAGGGLQVNFPYEYIAVAEWTDANGQRVRGPASPPVTKTTGGADTKITVGGLMMHTTGKTNIAISLYRTIAVGVAPFSQSTEHYKVTSDLAPVLNDDTTATFSFVDTMADSTAAVNEKLYTDKDLIDRFPAPPFSVGCTAKGRAFVVGYDNAVWFSGEKTEGDPYWFSPLFRILVPTNERVTQIKAIDNLLLIFTQRTGAWWIPISQLPDATGAGEVPRAERLRSTSGCTGFAASTELGVFYSSAQGGVWLTRPDLTNVFIGADVQTDTAASPVVAIAADKDQYVYVLLANGTLLVFDQVSSCWYVWAMTKTPMLLAVHKGQLVFVSTESTATVWRQNPASYSDVNSAAVKSAINRTINIERVHFGPVRGYQRVWDAQFEGEYIGVHGLTVTAKHYADDRNDTPITGTYAFTPDGGPYIYELPPKVEQCTSIEYTFVEDSLTDTAAFALELLSFYVGIDKGLAKQPTVRRIAPA